MSIDVHNYEINIEIAEIPCDEVYGGLAQPVSAARIGDKIYFARSPADSFVLNVAEALTLNGTTEAMTDYDVALEPRTLRLALRRLDARGGEVNLNSPDVDGHEGQLVSRGGGRVDFVAPCGEQYQFELADLQTVVDELGG